MSAAVPKYRRQRRKGRQDSAFVEIDGKRHYLGRYDSLESRKRYAELIAGEKPKSPEPDAGPVTVNRILIEFLKHAEGYYRGRDNKPTAEFTHYKSVARMLRKHGHESAERFGPRKLKAIRETMVQRGWTRKYVNDQTKRIVRVIKWAVGEELIPANVHQALAAVEGLRRGRTTAKESTKRQPVPMADVLATVEHLPQVVADLVLVQLYGGMRPTEAMIMRPCDIDRSGDVWTYRPHYHKTEDAGCERVITLGPRAQAILLRYLARDERDYLFSPRDSEAKRLAEREACRKTPRSFGNTRGTNRKSKPKQTPGEHYNKDSYARAVKRAAKRAGVRHWSPYQLRHTQATEARKLAGLDAAQRLLGHRHAATTERYAEPDVAAAAEVVRKIG